MGKNGCCTFTICLVMNLLLLSCRVDTSYTSASTATHKRTKPFNGSVYLRVPRIEALVIKLRDRSLHPGDMSCWKNLISVSEFTSEFLIYFPTARKAEAMFRGVKGPDSSVKTQLQNFFGFKKVYVSIFEENPLRPITSLDPSCLKIGFGSGLHALETIVGNTLGAAGKVCIEILSDNFKVTSKPRTNNYDYEKGFDTITYKW
ncbi:hypothetical protein LSTR_LSTR010818 [Laodelphax striatellus]|uniref:Uncharacterized protein n=1 Tax=Laodelphax striatellus TaxID=195883 RepID=A0A482XJB4_LAOST|nr:hypothetical protein LSTR_LSTR010818 [Laodelphax striatellus]